MSARSCELWRHDAAVDALGGLDPDERAGLRAHLDGCAACREVAAELAETAGVLAAVDHETVHQAASVPPGLAARVLGALHDDAATAHRRRRAVVVGSAVTAVAAAVALILALVVPGSAGPASRTEAMRGAAGASATAVLTSRSWGTAVAISEHGLRAGQVYEVAMRTGDGRWWATGSFSAPARPAVPQMGCAVPLRAITGIRVTTAGGATVLESLASPGTTW